jgi:dUTP pyrophosphatase
MRVRVTRIDQSLPLPEYRTAGATGFDFKCRSGVTVESRSVALIPSNVIVCVPDGYVLLVTLRSGTPRRTGLTIPHGVGVIDADYCGPDDEIMIQVYNPTDSPISVHRGDRIAQGLLMPVSRLEWDEDSPLRNTSRGGFGSTDR